MLTFLAFLVAIGVLVTFHELGHYWVARLCGVKVLRFSVGFGAPLYTFRRGDTEWAISPIPLGGYVRMLDEREMDVAPEERHLAFNTQSVYKRMAIVAAGPLANLVLAVLFYWVVIAGGVNCCRKSAR
jgi:regulator of sigma E protease